MCVVITKQRIALGDHISMYPPVVYVILSVISLVCSGDCVRRRLYLLITYCLVSFVQCFGVINLTFETLYLVFI